MNQNKTTNEIKEFYDTVYYQNSSYKLTISNHLKKLAKQCQFNKNEKILDVGCGKGEWLLASAKYQTIPSGIDLSEKAIQICQHNMPEGTFYAQAAESLPFPDNEYDHVSCLGSLEHFIDPESALKEMVRVAKDNAQFIILVPNKDFLTRRLGLYSGTNQKDAKEVVRTINEWEALFNQAGLNVINKEKDLHVLSLEWIFMNKWFSAPIRFLQAIALTIWPLKWQYQIYFFCRKK